MAYKFNLAGACITPCLLGAVLFAPETLLFAGGMYLAGVLSSEYLKSTIEDGECTRLRGKGKSRPDPGDNALGAAEAGGRFIEEFSMFFPIMPVAAVLAGSLLDRKAKEAKKALRYETCEYEEDPPPRRKRRVYKKYTPPATERFIEWG